MAERRRVRGWPSLWAALFLLGICLPLVEQVAELDPAPPVNENRHLAERPRLPPAWAEIDDFPSRFEAYYRDRFGLRNRLLRWHRWLHLRLLGVSPVDKVMIGRDGWLFLAEKALRYQRSRPFKAVDLAAWGTFLEERRQWLGERGIRFLWVLAPNKHTVYAEHLPPRGRALRATSRADQLLEHLRLHTGVEALDLRPALRAGKAREKVFYKLDSHWNDYGSYLAYHAVIERLGSDLPGLEPVPIDAHRRRQKETSGDLALVLGLEDELLETSVVLRPRGRRLAVPASTVPPGVGATAFERPDGRYRALFLGDSFGAHLTRRLAEHFARLAYLPGYDLPRQVLDRERPDVVILEIVERNLAASDLPHLLLRNARAQRVGEE